MLQIICDFSSFQVSYKVGKATLFVHSEVKYVESMCPRPLETALIEFVGTECPSMLNQDSLIMSLRAI